MEDNEETIKFASIVALANIAEIGNSILNTIILTFLAST